MFYLSQSWDRLHFQRLLTSEVFSLTALEQDIRWPHAIPVLNKYSPHLFYGKPSCVSFPGHALEVQADGSTAAEPGLFFHCSLSFSFSPLGINLERSTNCMFKASAFWGSRKALFLAPTHHLRGYRTCDRIVSDETSFSRERKTLSNI